MSERKVAREELQQHWVHSHEEDTDTEMVFRPATFRFPPSRGRTGFDLKPDSSCAGFGIRPADGIEEYPGTWELDEEGHLTVYDDRHRPVQVMEVISADSDRLVVKK